jgi:methyl-accepting chemotaxis protein
MAGKIYPARMTKTFMSNKTEHWTIGKRIISGGAILIGLLLLVSGVAILSLSRLDNFAGAHLRDESIPGIVYCSDMVQYSLRGYINSLLVAGISDPAKRVQLMAQVKENSAKITVAATNYEAAITSAEDRLNFKELLKKRADYSSARDAYFALVKAGQTAEAEAFVLEKLEPVFTTYREHANMMLKWNQDLAVRVTNEMVRTARRTTLITSITAGFSVLIAIALGWITIRGVNRVLIRAASSLGQGSSQVVSAAGQVSSASQTLAEGASEQASSLEEAGASLEELSSMTKRNAGNARKADELAKQARSAADKGSADMQSMSAAMAAIKVSSDDISKIIKTIDEIAFQTNILALNAAVEAARAGEAGMGFAVVADEVRNLAQRSAQAARETAAKIEGAIVNTTQGVELSGKVAQTLNDIVAKARQVAELVAEVDSASQEQTQGLTQINTAVCQIEKVTQSNAASAEESAAAAQELNAQANAMKESVAELLQLVGKRLEYAAEAAPARSTRSRPFQASGPVSKAHPPVPGHSPAPLAKATAGNGRQRELPMVGDFKDF